MSNRYSNQNRNEKTQKKFVPKKEMQTSQTLANSFRQSVSIKSEGSSNAVNSSSAGSSAGEVKSRVRMGESGAWVSAAIPSGKFVDYLPQDEAVAAGLGADEGALDPMESQRVVDVLNRELCRLLKMNARDFWREVASDSSLRSFLESFLKFRSRWYDFPYRGARGIVAGVVVGEFELCRRIFMVLYRISSNRDPGAKTADSLTQKDHEALLQEKKLLDLPKLLDICAIYGHENEDLTRILVVNAIKSQPWIHDDLSSVITHFLSIVQTMYERCSSSLEVMDFLNDAVVSMDAFVNAYKQASIYFCCPVEMSHGNEEVLTTLARLHNSLLPSLRRGFHIILTSGEKSLTESSNEMRSNVFVSLKMLSTRIVNFGWKLLYLCYLSDEAFVESSPLPATMKMFPTNVEDPAIRADILVQSVRDISGDYSQALEGHSKGTFLQIIEQNYNIMSRIELLRNTGWISMDDDQFKFLSGITIHPVEDNVGRAAHPAASGKDNRPQVDEDAAIMESKISQIKDLFPDYGKGFLAACLEVYNQNPEEVIQRILEGTLHEELQSLDISLEKIPPPKSDVASMTRNDKGKGKLVESTPMPPRNIVPAASPYKAVGSSNSSIAPAGRFIRKTTSEEPASLTLDSRDAKDLAKTLALSSQLEYEDEYDDSFDDLGLSIGDSAFEETENLQDKTNFSRGRNSEADNGSSASNASKWGSRKMPQFYVKDGKNYSYKVEGAVAVANYNEASIVNQAQKELIHGLGRGGNLPLGAVKRLTEPNEEKEDEPESNEMGGRGRGRGFFRGGRGGRRRDSNEEKDNDPESNEMGGRGGGRGFFRGGRGGRRGGESNEEKDNEPESNEMDGRGGGRGFFKGGRGGRRGGESNEEKDNEPESNEMDGSGGGRGFRGGRGGRRGGGRSNHYRKDQAMKKHFSGLTGH
ncbi:hypothetical protein MTR67_020713 [Solanum verrucosum]|uniref:CUE domain-containing protein n=1 Tax=Solanum verrucosum TaxID=315347 RepID=A0AAF0QQA6_SOLVR|nr:hypothetical protein MTR67_020713 [Solanum verrucosum]